MRRLRRFLWTALAVAFLGVAWIWDKLHPIVAAIVALIPLESLKAAIRRLMERLPPYPTLIVFLVPAILHELMKAAAVWLFAAERWFAAVLVYIGADIVGLALCAFVFEANRAKLLSIPWFNRGYLLFVAAHRWAENQVAPLKARMRQILAEAGWRNGRTGALSRLRALWRRARRHSGSP